MAKGNLFLGMARKKIGDVVFYRANGEQISRARNRAPRNPRSAKQSIQRMVLATASKMAAAWRPIVDHSFEGYNVGQDSVRHFQQLAMARLRGQAAYIINGGMEFSVADFAIKGAPIVGKSEGLRISSGSISMQPFRAIGDGEYTIPMKDEVSQSITTQEQYVAELDKLGLEPGDQLTFVCIQENTSIPVASFGTITNYAQRVRYARVVFKPTLPENFSGVLIDLNNGTFNSALIERTEGVFPKLTAADDATLTFSASDGLWTAVQGGFIRSKIDANGKWRYSTCDLASDRTDFDENNAIGVYPSYGNNVEGIDLGDNLYLRNAVATTLGN